MAKKKKMDRSAKIMAWKTVKDSQSFNYKDIADELNVPLQAVRGYLRRRFKEEADLLWSKTVKDSEPFCAVSDGNCKGEYNAHHLLGKNAYPQFRYTLDNGCKVCANHHTFHPTMSAHGKEDNFIQNLRDRGRDMSWYDEHRYDKAYREVDYEWEYYQLKHLFEV